MQHRCLTKARRPNDCVSCAGLDLKIQVLEEVLEFALVAILTLAANRVTQIISSTLHAFVAKTYIAELDLPTLESKFFSVWALNYLWLLLEHIEQVFNIDLRLRDLSEQCAHIEKRSSQLHKVSLNQDEIARSHDTIYDVIGCHEQVQSQTSRINHSLSDVQLRKRCLHNHGTPFKLA